MPLQRAPLALALLSACPTWAAPAPDEAGQLPTVSVTAKGYAADDLETPLATLAVERESLVQRQAQTLGDALRGLPGLSVASDGAHGQNPVVRGLRRESVVLLVDGVRLNAAQPQGAIGSLASVALAERIEVVKGPASVLYGTGAIGGAIQVRLPQARFESGLGFTASASVDGASQSLHANGVLQVSQGDHAFMAGTSAARVGDDNSPAGPVAHTGYDSQAIIAQYRYRIDGAQQLRVSLQQQKDEDVWYPGSRKPHANAALVGHTMVHSPVQQRQLVEVGYTRKGAGDRPLNLDLRAYRQDVDRSIWSFSERLQRDIGKTQVRFATEGADLKADWLAHPRHLLSAGVNLWRMTAAPDRYLASPTPASPLVRNLPFEDGRLQAAGLFVQDDMRLGERWSLLAGLRHDHVRGDAASIGNGAVRANLARQDSATSGSVGLLYEAAPLIRPWVHLSRGFRAGEMRERFEASPRGDGYHYLGNPQIRPEKATQFELGIKGANDRLNYAVSVYRNRITDYITGSPTGGVIGGLPVKQTVNLGEVVLRGAEASARWQWPGGHWLSASYTRLRGDNRDLAEPLFQMPADELTLGWDGPLAPGWSADARWRLVARQNRVATLFARGTEDATAGFATVDLGLNWRLSPRQSIRFALKNLADKAYHEHLSEGVSGQEILAPGRSLQVSWQGHF